MGVRLRVYAAFYRRVRHYRQRIAIHDGRPEVASRFVKAVRELVPRLLQNPGVGHLTGFESADLADVLRVSIPAFPVFGLFYRWDGETLTVITLEHTAQDLPSRLAGVLSAGG